MACREWLEFLHQEVAGGFFDHGGRNWIEPLHIRINQCVFAEKIHYPGNSAGIIVQGFDGGGLEDRLSGCAGDAQPVGDVAAGLVQGERRGVAPERNSLPKLPHFRAFQLLFEFRLANKDDLQKFFGRSLKIQQQPDLLQQFEGKTLGFVDDQDGGGSRAEAGDEPLVQFDEHIADQAIVRGDPKIIENEIEEMVDLQMRIEDEGGGCLPFTQPIEEVVDQRGLACSDFAGEKKQTLTVLNTVSQLVQSFLDARGSMQKTRVGVDVERIFAKSKETLVHGCVITIPGV